jgi:hypothetical protein
MKKIKILVGYHRPAQLLRGDIFVPIRAGHTCAREACMDGAISDADSK